ncbi:MULTISPECIES: hypothetical protein [Herbaspirillum]|uniref:Uncharacterized protein n=2 Tax=Herbaspirillum huttiense TaxID=863372 RepID=A0AAJ2H578_9BURK|nr:MULTISPECIES: hypothetical protein [Herbaspirillum]MDR9836977.1 hypothetical protein [Herbaspirillum huttiense]
MIDKSKISAVITLAKRTNKTAPAAMSLSGPAGKRVVVSAAKRVIKTHSEVIKALAKR